MAEPTKPDPALLVVGVLYPGAEQELLESARKKLALRFGALRVLGRPLEFGWTDYYQAEIGPGLVRRFLAAERLFGRERLAELKLETNAVERELARPDGRRRINLDPGLLTAENFVLASTKRRGQRVYLRDGIYAEVTLVFTRGAFEPLEWTYPDYRSQGVRDILESARREYMHILSEAGTAAERKGPGQIAASCEETL